MDGNWRSLNRRKLLCHRIIRLSRFLGSWWMATLYSNPLLYSWKPFAVRGDPSAIKNTLDTITFLLVGWRDTYNTVQYIPHWHKFTGTVLPTVVLSGFIEISREVLLTEYCQNSVVGRRTQLHYNLRIHNKRQSVYFSHSLLRQLHRHSIISGWQHRIHINTLAFNNHDTHDA